MLAFNTNESNVEVGGFFRDGFIESVDSEISVISLPWELFGVSYCILFLRVDGSYYIKPEPKYLGFFNA